MKNVSWCTRLGVAVAAIALPIGAGAATIDADLVAGEYYTDGFTLSPGETQQYNFTILEDLRIAAFSVSGTGGDSENDLADIRFGLLNPPEDSFDEVETEMGAFGANDFVSGATFSAGDMFSFYFSDGIDAPVSLTLSFDTESLAPIPVPAGGLLLLSVLAGGTALARRKKKAA